MVKYEIFDTLTGKIVKNSYNGSPITDKTIAARIAVNMCIPLNDFRRYDFRVVQVAK